VTNPGGSDCHCGVLAAHKSDISQALHQLFDARLAADSAKVEFQSSGLCLLGGIDSGLAKSNRISRTYDAIWLGTSGLAKPHLGNCRSSHWLQAQEHVTY
jgi:hypothetical protein